MKTWTCIVMLGCAMFGAAQTDVLTQHNDNDRTGAVLNESRLSHGVVQSGAFKLVRRFPVDGQVYAQPLVVTAVPFQVGSRTKFRNLLVVCTANDSIYCYDYASSQAAPVWWKSLGTPVPFEDVGSEDMQPTIGVASTPVIDRASMKMWVVAKTKEMNGSTPIYSNKLHCLDLKTGNEEPGSPIEIDGAVRGSAYDGVGGLVQFNQLQQMNRPGLLLDNGVVYVAFASHGDGDPYHGWVFAYDASSLAQLGTYCTSPDGDETYYLPSGAGGIWMSGAGLACDASHNVYFMSGNGAFSHDSSGRQTGNSFVKLHLDPSGLNLVDFFTPHDSDSMNATDQDLGSSGVLHIPNTNLLIGAGKLDQVFVLDSGNMGGYSPSTDNCLQRLHIIADGSFTSPVYFNSATWGPVIFYGGQSDIVRAFRITGGLVEQDPFRWTGETARWPGSMLALSANGTQNPILWALQKQSTGSGAVLRAFDADNLDTELWNSDMNPGDSVGLFAKFCPPTIANGRVFVPTFSNEVDMYGVPSQPPGPLSGQHSGLTTGH